MKKILLLGALCSISLANLVAQTATEIIMPRFIQGTTVDGNPRRVAFPCRLTLSGLTANATYRYLTRVIIASNGSTNAGAGNLIVATNTGSFVRPGTAPSNFATATDYGQFVTNAAGSYTGWFVVEPTSNSTRFIPGNDVFIRIVTNDGNGGTTFFNYITAPSPVKVIDSAATNAVDRGTGIYSTPAVGANPMDFVFLYDNLEGTGRPVAGTFVEDDGTIGSSYAIFYRDSVNARANTWGTIIPQNLAGGIKRIATFSRDNGNAINASFSPTGKWASGVVDSINTVNAVGPVAMRLDGAGVTLPIEMNSVKAYATSKEHIIEWACVASANVLNYQVEHANASGNFISVGTLPVNSLNKYQFKYSTLATGLNFYRVKAVLATGGVKYSQKLVLQHNNKSFQLQAYPNPAQNYLLVQHSETVADASLSILTVEGKQISTVVIPKNAQQTNMNVSGLKPGTYVLKFANSSEVKTILFLKQ